MCSSKQNNFPNISGVTKHNALGFSLIYYGHNCFATPLQELQIPYWMVTKKVYASFVCAS
jgi:hypothetical protein